MLSELFDTSAWAVSKRRTALADEFSGLLSSGSVATCDQVRFELLYGARNFDEFCFLRTRLAVLDDCPIEKQQWQRALDVYEALAERGGSHQRQVKRQDLLIAAAAEAAGIPVVHYDADYDAISAITGQETRWFSPRGSI